MKKGVHWISLAAILLLLVAACSKGEEDVVEQLGDRLESLQSYKYDAQLVLHTGEAPQEYDVQVWHRKPDHYRIALTNRSREVTHIILRNNDGVFVLTPHLNKSFRFQSGWPENHGQVYLYESLVKDVLADSNRTFSTEKDQYVFQMGANYQNKTLTQQKLHLTKELHPVSLDVMDTDYNVLVHVQFANVQFDPAFEDDAFEMERNMQGALLEALPAMAEELERNSGSFGTYYPSYIPSNVSLIEEEEIEVNGKPRVVLRYAGDYQFNLIQERPEARMVHLPYGQPVDLGFTIGVLTDTNLFWTYDGVDFLLSTGNLPENEMIAIAKSVVGQSSK